MSLAVEQRGQGRNLVLLHGWGMNSAVWSEFADRLAARYRLWLIDLPGHGQSGYAEELGLADWAQACLAVVPSRSVWLGWSLGAQIAIEAALQEPDRISALISLCGTPRFAQADDWPAAMAQQTLDQFISASREDHRKTLERFLALQVRGSEQARESLRVLKQQLRLKPDPQPAALDAGLELLKQVDLRERLTQLDCPLGWLFGGRDTLVPDGTAEALPEWMPGAQRQLIAGAAHAPFLSHPDETLAVLLNMLEGFDAAI
ncbi:MAG: pimeloyl-ACP methyl ester esterase BioH [Gammaproteobacteria bacterium]|nr:pimeloyl-ACP methyl ester esterase BioH [Gammaproteobacteria bacterium]